MSQHSKPRVAIVFPVYDDWEALSDVLIKLDSVWYENKDMPDFLDIVMVDDAPHLHRDSGQNLNVEGQFKHLKVSLLKLDRNLGHQRAIVAGITHTLKNIQSDWIVVMDSDGEDRPEDVPRLLRLAFLNQNTVVFAERTWRGDVWWFKAGYYIYRLLHWSLTGHRIKFGNFSAAPSHLAKMIVKSPESSCHYAAAVVRLKLRHILLPTRRGLRICGRSKMAPAGLIVHGLSAVSLFYDVAAVRLVLLFFVCAVLDGITFLMLDQLVPSPQRTALIGLHLLMDLGCSFAAILLLVLLLLRTKIAQEIVTDAQLGS